MSELPKMHVTALEDRLAPALFGQTWASNENITVSFAPDGTPVAGVASTMEATLGKTMSKDAWQTTIRQAFQTWLQETNVNFSFVNDDKAAFGVEGTLAGASTRGDIRIAARPLSDNVLIISNPPDLSSSWAGEIIINSNKTFTDGGAGGTYDLYTSILQEAGHVLGMSNSTDPKSVMFETYSGPRTGLTAGDVVAIQKLYGTRAADRFEGATDNNRPKRAAEIDYIESTTHASEAASLAIPSIARADLTNASDVDFYKIIAPANAAATLNVLLRTANASQLSAKVSLLDSNKATIATASASGPGKDIAFTASGIQPNATYYVKIEAADTRFGVGAYRLMAGGVSSFALSFLSTMSISTGQGAIDAQDGKTHDKIASAIDLGTARTSTDARWDVVGFTMPTYFQAQTVYKIATNATSPSVMIATVWSTQFIKANLRITVMDELGNILPVRQLRSDGFAHVVELDGVLPSKTYYLSVKDDLSFMNVAYGIGIDFRATPIALQNFAEGTLTGLNNETQRKFTVTRSQMFRFELTVQSLTGQQEVFANIRIRDANGVIVFEVQSDSGQTIAKDVLLGVGNYTVSLMGSTTDGSVLGQLQLTARYTVLSDPIGPSLMGPTGTPYTMTSPPTVPPPVTTPPMSPPTIAVPPVVTPIDPYLQGYYWEPLPTDAMMYMWW